MFKWKHPLTGLSLQHHNILNIIFVFITARKRSLGQGNVFTPICQSFCWQWPPKRAVRILLERILVIFKFRKNSFGHELNRKIR